MRFATFGIFALLATYSHAQTFSYEADLFPEEVGFERVGTMDAERWIDGGWLFQDIDVGMWGGGPHEGEQDFYALYLAQFVGETFFIEWRVETDAPASEINGTRGAVAVLEGSGILYHFTMVEDRVRFIRGSEFPIIYADLVPGVPHDYRLMPSWR